MDSTPSPSRNQQRGFEMNKVSDAATGEGWIGVDLDGTLAYYGEWLGPAHIGAPILKMVQRVKGWLKEGKKVKIFTARVSPSAPDYEQSMYTIASWCREHIGQELPMTASKDLNMIELWDDRAIQVEKNTGRRIDECIECGDQLTDRCCSCHDLYEDWDS